MRITAVWQNGRNFAFAKSLLEHNAIENGILAKAEEIGKAQLEAVFKAFGFKEVNITITQTDGRLFIRQSIKAFVRTQSTVAAEFDEATPTTPPPPRAPSPANTSPSASPTASAAPRWSRNRRMARRPAGRRLRNK